MLTRTKLAVLNLFLQKDFFKIWVYVRSQTARYLISKEIL